MNTFFVVGFMGCGKSYWGKIWAEAYGLAFYETDELVETAEGKTIAAILRQMAKRISGKRKGQY
jgi:shikimate kinase